MLILKVYGDRFISADTLLDNFHQGTVIGSKTLDSDRKKILNNIEKITAAELWPGGAPGNANLVVTKWVA